jgi:hypothetical protein
MDSIILLFSISIGVVLGIFALWKILCLLDTYTLHFFLPWFKKYLLYSLILPRQRGSSGLNLLSLILVLVYFGSNIFTLVFKARSEQGIAVRAADISLINLFSLYSGYRINLLFDLLRLEIQYFQIIHRWIGRICILFGLIHGIMQIFIFHHKLNILEILVSYTLIIFDTIVLIQFRF